ncbi:MAG TPA: glycosyltransferase family 2 protein [Fibrobacteria bacterium]|nr:glycosyltransferase family 2 protein [Fibrobacteria bacterium]
MPTPASPLVSVGIPTYNRPAGLRRALECVTAQTFRDLDIIVSDNASPGTATEEVVREFMAKDPRIRYFRQDKNIGGNGNFRFVFEQGRGDFWAWAADDDEWDPEFVEVCLGNLLDPAHHAVLAFCHVRRKDPATGRLVTERYSDKVSSTSRGLLARSFRYIYHSGSNHPYYGLYRRSAINPWFWEKRLGNDHLALASILLDGCIHIDERVLFTSAIGGAGFRREAFHRFYDSKVMKVCVNLSSTLTWFHEFSRFVWVEPRYTLAQRLALQLFVVVRFLRPRYWRRFAGDMVALLFRWRIWRFE